MGAADLDQVPAPSSTSCVVITASSLPRPSGLFLSGLTALAGEPDDEARFPEYMRGYWTGSVAA